MSDTWLFVGGNKDLPTQYVQALRFAQRFTTITTNRGIVWLRVPDYHFVTNQGGILPLWHELALEALKRGTHVVTPSGRKAIGYADTFIDASEGFPRRGGYGEIRISGPTCLEFACNNGAKRILLVGATGYPENHDPSYFDTDAIRHCQKAPGFNHMLSSQITLVCKAWDDVEFICFGVPTFTVDAANWRSYVEK